MLLSQLGTLPTIPQLTKPGMHVQALEIVPGPAGDDMVNIIGVNSACPPQLAAAALPTGPQTPPPGSMLCSYGVIKNVSKL